MKLAGEIDHNDLFFRVDGTPIRDLNYPYDRWRWTLSMTLKARYREPYNARHSFVSWNLMLGKNLLWVAKQHGHSVQTMLDVYAAWIDGSQDADLEAIRTAMEASPCSAARTPSLMLAGVSVAGLLVATRASSEQASHAGKSVKLTACVCCVRKHKHGSVAFKRANGRVGMSSGSLGDFIDCTIDNSHPETNKQSEQRQRHQQQQRVNAVL